MKLISVADVEMSLYRWHDLKPMLLAKEPIPEEGSYLLYRIPGLILTNSGDLIAYYECRAGGDWSAIDLCMRRSSDGGKSWSERTVLATGKGRTTMNNPVMIPDGEQLHFLYCESYKRLFYRNSQDGGITWSQPRELTEQVEASTDFFWSCIAPGPGHGIRSEGGRLLVPVWFAQNRLDIYAHHPSILAVLYSDDGGTTWQVSAPLCNGDIANPNESTLAQLPDGQILINVRNEHVKKRRATAISKDNGLSYTQLTLDEDLPDPICQGALISTSNELLFTHCDSETARENLTLRRLPHGTDAWEVFPISELGGYSDVAFCESTKRAYVLYECDDCKHLRFAVVSL